MDQNIDYYNCDEIFTRGSNKGKKCNEVFPYCRNYTHIKQRKTDLIISQKSDQKTISQKSDQKTKTISQKSDQKTKTISQKSDKTPISHKSNQLAISQKSDQKTKTISQKSDKNPISQKSDKKSISQKSDQLAISQKPDQISDQKIILQKSDQDITTITTKYNHTNYQLLYYKQILNKIRIMCHNNLAIASSNSNNPIREIEFLCDIIIMIKNSNINISEQDVANNDNINNLNDIDENNLTDIDDNNLNDIDDNNLNDIDDNNLNDIDDNNLNDIDETKSNDNINKPEKRSTEIDTVNTVCGNSDDFIHKLENKFDSVKNMDKIIIAALHEGKTGLCKIIDIVYNNNNKYPFRLYAGKTIIYYDYNKNVQYNYEKFRTLIRLSLQTIAGKYYEKLSINDRLLNVSGAHTEISDIGQIIKNLSPTNKKTNEFLHDKYMDSILYEFRRTYQST